MGHAKMVHLAPDIHAWVRRVAARRGMSMTALVEMSIRRLEGAEKKILPVLPESKPANPANLPFWERSKRCRKRS